mmetsp:Transcript_17901/g.15647  ORF Transcript_17901/g.15647 Transcript_17901/m.15647 type:complete len:189 (-) Transcript_17901:389-955(-)
MNKLILALFALAFISLANSKVQTGKFSRDYWSSGHSFELYNIESRQEFFIVKFREPFSQVPNVEVGILGLDLRAANAGIFLDVARVTKDGFTVRATCPAKSQCFSVTGDFIAFTSDEQFETKTFSEQGFDSSKINSWSNGSGSRVGTKTVSTSLSGDIGAISFIRGFKFKTPTDTNARISTTVDSASQ